MSKDLVDVQTELFEKSFKSVCRMNEEFKSVTDHIVAEAAWEMAERFRGMPLRVRQELLVIMEQYQDNPDQLLLQIQAYEQRIDRIYSNPFSRLKRWLCNGEDNLSQSDWVVLAVTIAFIAILPIGVYLMGQTLQVFQEPSTEQVK